jgi:DNA-directed RNA polymerase subunit K
MMIEKLEGKFTRYEIARILGARSLQISMDAPILLKLTKEEMEKIDYDSLKMAEKELEAGVLPITVVRPLPKRSEKSVKKLSEEEIKEKLEQEIKEKEKLELEIKQTEKSEEKEIKESKAEIMEMASPEDEQLEDTNEDLGGSDEELV